MTLSIEEQAELKANIKDITEKVASLVPGRIGIIEVPTLEVYEENGQTMYKFDCKLIQVSIIGDVDTNEGAAFNAKIPNPFRIKKT